MRLSSKTLLIAIILIILNSFNAFALDSKNKFIIILVNQIDLEDIETMPSVKQIAQSGSIGLMNTRSYNSNNEFSSAATIGFGTRADASYYTSRSFNLEREKIKIYKRRTDYDIDGAQIANLDIAKLININQNNNYNPYVGALGDTLNEIYIKASIIGNSDTDERNVRLGVLIGMDGKGLIDYGDIGRNLLIDASSYPFGIKTNYRYLMKKFEEFQNKSDLIIIELGDIYRLEEYKNNITDKVYKKYRKKIVLDIDSFIKELYRSVDLSKTAFLIVNPYPSSEALRKREKLTPIILAGKNIKTSILTSATTRREGIIGNIDVAPYVAKYFGGALDKFTGQPFYVTKSKDNFSFIKKLSASTAFIYKNRINVLYTFAIFQIIVSMISFIGIQLKNKYKLRIFKYIEYFLLSTMTIPFVLLILPILEINNLFQAFIVIITLSLIITIISVLVRKKPIDSIILMSGITCIGLIIDIFNSSTLIKESFLGYDPIIGARYYGIGNEFMGILVSSAIVFVTALMDRFKLRPIGAILFFLITAVVIGFPKLGANVGGTITAVFSFMFIIIKLYNDSKINLKHFLYIFISVILLISFMALIDLILLKNKSHLAKALEKIYDGGLEIIYSIIARKLAMNIKLFGVTIWSKVLVSSIVFLTVLFYRPFGACKKIFDKYKNYSIGLVGVLVACIVGFIVNDSGVVVAGTSIIFLAASLMYLVFKEVEC